MKKILVLRGNPRKEGYTRLAADMVVAGMHAAGAEVRDVDLSTKDIAQCLGCYHCWTNDEGTCAIEDDMTGLLDDLRWCDVLFCATPLYHFSMSSSLKIFFERTLCITKQGIEMAPSGMFRNISRNSSFQGKALSALSVGALRGDPLFSGLVRTFELIADGIHFANAGIMVRPESYLMQFALAKPRTMKIIETGLARAGYELATAGVLSEKTIADVATPLAVDANYFQMYSNIYWEHVGNNTESAASVDSIRDAVLHDVRILMNEFSRSFDPVAGSRLRAVMVFRFPDRNWAFRIAVKDGACSMTMEDDPSPDMAVSAESTVWAQAFTREISMRDALASGKVKVEGDKSLFMRLERFFPPPNN